MTASPVSSGAIRSAVRPATTRSRAVAAGTGSWVARAEDKLQGGGGKDLLNGGGGNDVLKDGKGKDVIKGGGGRDVIRTPKGRDRINCGGGRDTVYLSPKDVVNRNCERLRYSRRKHHG